MANELGANLSGIKSIGDSRVGSGSSSGMGMGASGYGRMSGDPFDSSPTSTTDGQITLQSTVDVVFYLGSTEFKK